MNKIKIILVSILISVVLFSCLGFLGYFGIKTVRRTHLRMEGRKAFAAEDWKNAKKLLSEYVTQDPDSEEDLVRLAKVYQHFGDAEKEMHCWYKASALNPLKPEYGDLYTECAMKARAFGHLYSSLSRKARLGQKFAPEDQMRYLICAVMTNRTKEAEQYYERMRSEDTGAEVFQKDDLARFAEFLVTKNAHTSVERSFFVDEGIVSDDPFVRLESILQYLVDWESSGDDEDAIFEKEETMLKEAVSLNRFIVIPLLANVYFCNLKFGSVIEVAEPYLANIENNMLSVLYAESCVYDAQPEKLKPLAEHYHTLGWKSRLLASYFDALYEFSQGQSAENNEKLAKYMQDVNGAIKTDLANLIELQVALNSDTLEKICGSLETIMTNPPFYDLQERARSATRHYLETKIKENPAFPEDSRAVKLAQLISGTDTADPLLMRIMISDLRKRNMLTRLILQEKLEAFPIDPYLLEVAAEFELFNGDPEKCLEYVERFYKLKEEKHSPVLDHMHMLALQLSGKVDEAAKEYSALLENNEMDRGILYRYFRFCINHKRQAELTAMADRLDASNMPEMKALAPFFRAEDLFLQGKKDEALSLLETAETDHPDFALRAATMFSSYDLLDQALSRYLALVGKHPDQKLVFADIAEIYLAKGMKAEALSYAKQAWETNRDDRIGQFVYAKMLDANELYQDAERILKIPYNKLELPDEIKELWTDIMLHCVKEDLSNGLFSRALERAQHYLIFFPDDSLFQKLKVSSELKIKKPEFLDSEQ